ncbi:hypothetical protein MLD38_032045 [Melastoma candidum]|uniref:Uncharacterized protein n=1 Tax=Melastoma candidum TaxID=119954 RepID=A0ACB9MW38_9MYRT|nr:hypothetical protein MLD38_032045 [Melastoma candidum]
MSEESDSDDTDLSEEKLNHEEFFRLWEKLSKKVEDNSPSESSESGYIDIEVTDENTNCTLYANGSYIAHKEEGLLEGVVDQVGVRYKLEWRHTYASVWVRRVPEWFCFKRLIFQIEEVEVEEEPQNEEDPSDQGQVGAEPNEDIPSPSQVETEEIVVMTEKVKAARYGIADCGVQAEGRQEQGETLNLELLVSRAIDGFSEAEEEVKLIQCQAMKVLIENVGQLTAEFKDCLQELTDRVREGAHRKFIDLYGMDLASSAASDKFEREAKERHKKQIRMETSLMRLDECMHGLMMQIDLMESDPKGFVGTYSISNCQAELLKLFEDWRVVVNRKKESLSNQLREWDEAIRRMTRRVNRPPLTEAEIAETISFLHGIFVEPPNGAGTSQQAQGNIDIAPLSLLEDINLISATIIDKRSPPVFDSKVTRRIMAMLEGIEEENCPRVRRHRCLTIRDYINALEGEAEYLGDLHEELLCIVDKEAPAPEVTSPSLPKGNSP